MYALGDTTSDVANAVQYILEDPALPQVAGLLIELHNLSGPSSVHNVTQAAHAVGIGLNKAIVPLQLVVQVKKNPILGYLTIGAVLAIPFMLGYLLGKR
jgi:hypothetical protein